jgi:hypothetical protein
MRTLRIYGDSYAAAWSGGGWGEQLGRRLGIPVVNKGVGGSSTEFSMINFTQDITDNTIEDDDIICFVTSTPGRLELKHITENIPSRAVNYFHVPPKTPEHTWYWDNKDHIEWYMVNRDERLLAINHESYIHTIKDYARSKPNATFVLLQNSYRNLNIPGGLPPPNFLMPDIFLGEIQKNEVVDWKGWDDFSEYYHDPRINHLCNPNLTVLVDLLIYSIQQLTVDNFDYNYFHKQIISKITNDVQYTEYVKSGLLPEWPPVRPGVV